MRLPPAFLVLLCVPGAFANNLSSNDPFRIFSVQASQHSRFPVCCLKPTLPNSAVEDQILLSFQEWKEKQRNSGELTEQHVHGEDAHEVAFSTNDSKKDKSFVSAQNDSSQIFQPEDPIPQSHQRHFRVPLTDKFNYASLDCSARVHAAHRSAKSPSAVLNSKRDRYMLSPCKPASSESQFIVVELCEDIRIETVQLANFEFFSGVFKDFSVHVAKTDATNDKSWEDAGTFRAKNFRGIQSFHPPSSLRDFYRYIRIDFHSHYGNEYYCPVSLLRVYGLTHLEEYKWEQWEEQSKAKSDADARSGASGKVLDQFVDTPSIISVVELSGEGMVSSFPTPAAISSPGVEDSQPEPESVSSADTQTLLTDGPDWSTQSSQSETRLHDSLNNLESSQFPPVTTPDVSLSCNNVNSQTFADTLPSDSTVYAPISTSSGHSGSASSNQHLARTSSAPPTSSSPLSSSHSSVMATTSTLTSPIISQTVAPSTSGESIYRVIMNRLTALEANHTLYARYIEQQNIAVRDLLKRLSEDVGRLEGIGRAHGQTHQRAVQEWERQRLQLQVEFRELLAVVEYLSDEITLEKRLGIAQLCLLLLVLVFIAVTRGSRGEPLIHNEMTTSERPSNYQDLGRRLNLNIDRTKHLNSISSTEGDISTLSNQRLPDQSSRMRTGSGLDDEFMFPQPKMPLTSIDTNIPPSSSANRLAHQNPDVRPRKMSDGSRSRTPSSRRSIKRNVPHHLHLGPQTHFQYHGHQRTLTPSKSGIRQPMLGRSSSHPYEAYGYSALWSGVGSPRSARKSAKSAHLHEVVRTAPLRRNKDGGEEQRPRSSAIDVHLMRTRHRHTSGVHPELTSDVFTDDRKHLFSERNKVTGFAKDADDNNPESDQSAWEDTDSIAGEC